MGEQDHIAIVNILKDIYLPFGHPIDQKNLRLGSSVHKELIPFVQVMLQRLLGKGIQII